MTRRPLRFFRRGGSGPLIASRGFTATVPWVIAILTALTVIAAAGGLALLAVTGHARTELAGGASLQIAGIAPDRAEAQAKAALVVLNAEPGVASAYRLSLTERRELLAPWLGEAALKIGAEGDALALPEMIELRLAGLSGEAVLDRLASVAPDAVLSADSRWLEPVGDAIEALQSLALALVGLLALATVAAVLLASRNAFAANRETIELLHLLGAADRQIAALFQRASAISAALGGTIGFALGLIAVWLLSDRLAALGPDTGGGPAALGARQWLLIALIPILGTGLAALTAHATALASLRRMA